MEVPEISEKNADCTDGPIPRGHEFDGDEVFARSEALDDGGDFDFYRDIYVLDDAVGAAPVDLVVGSDDAGSLFADAEAQDLFAEEVETLETNNLGSGLVGVVVVA